MEILRHSVNDGERKEKILNDLLSTISSACAVTQEEQDAFFIGEFHLDSFLTCF